MQRRRDREKAIRQPPVLEGLAAGKSDTAMDTGWATTAFPDCRTPHTDGASWHHVLRPMAATASRWIDANEPRGWDVLAACATLNASPSFVEAQRAHEHD